jgi:hypothetical protein
MREPKNLLTLVCALLCWQASGVPARALIKVEFPVSRIYADSKAVIVGSISQVNPDNRVVDVKVDQQLKGDPLGDRLRVQITVPAPATADLKAGRAVVMFTGENAGQAIAVVHVADTWLMGHELTGTKTSAWRLVEPYKGVSFPGRTEALARLVTDLKSGKASILDEAYSDAFPGKVHELVKLDVEKPTRLAALDFNGDGKSDVLVTTAKGVRLFVSKAQGYTDGTEAAGLASVSAAWCAAGDANGDGKADLILGPSLWLREGERFVRKKDFSKLPPESDWLAAAIADATGDKKADAVVLLKTGKLIRLENPGGPEGDWAQREQTLWDKTETPGAAALSTDWGDNGELHALVVWGNDIVRYAAGPTADVPADYSRLTGSLFSTSKELAGKPVKVTLATAFDYDGDGRQDFVLVAETGGLVMINRGFGVFMAHQNLHAGFFPKGEPRLPFAIAPNMLTAAGKVKNPKAEGTNVLLLTPDGRLFELEAVHEEGK